MASEPKTTPAHETLVAIPVYNEAAHVAQVVGTTARYPCDILVIDDGSTDATGEILRSIDRIHLITHAENRGYGRSLADAFEFALGRGYTWLITMDCDWQHEPSHIPVFMSEALRDDADIISGTRYPSGRGVSADVPPDRLEINRRITALLNERLGLRITDAFCGFKAYRVSSLRKLSITAGGYAMPMQLWVQVARAGLRMREIPIRLIYNDPRRHFGGLLDDPVVRMRHYLETFEAELAVGDPPPVSARADCLPCR